MGNDNTQSTGSYPKQICCWYWQKRIFFKANLCGLFIMCQLKDLLLKSHFLMSAYPKKSASERMSARRSVTVVSHWSKKIVRLMYLPQTMAFASSVSFPSNITHIFPPDYHHNSIPSPIPLLESLCLLLLYVCQSHRDMCTPSPVLPQFATLQWILRILTSHLFYEILLCL